MAVEFDPLKEERNREKHRTSLAAAEAIFNGPFIEEEDVRHDYGEARFLAIGPIAALDNRIWVAVYTWRGGRRRIISFRKANGREVRKYRDSNA